MGYDGFKIFMSSYLGDTVSDELCQTLFWTFHKKVPASDAANIELPNALLKKFLVENGKLDSIDGYGKLSTVVYERLKFIAAMFTGPNTNEKPFYIC